MHVFVRWTILYFRTVNSLVNCVDEPGKNVWSLHLSTFNEICQVDHNSWILIVSASTMECSKVLCTLSSIQSLHPNISPHQHPYRYTHMHPRDTRRPSCAHHPERRLCQTNSTTPEHAFSGVRNDNLHYSERQRFLSTDAFNRGSTETTETGLTYSCKKRAA